MDFWDTVIDFLSESVPLSEVLIYRPIPLTGKTGLPSWSDLEMLPNFVGVRSSQHVLQSDEPSVSNDTARSRSSNGVLLSADFVPQESDKLDTAANVLNGTDMKAKIGSFMSRITGGLQIEQFDSHVVCEKCQSDVAASREGQRETVRAKESSARNEVGTPISQASIAAVSTSGVLLMSGTCIAVILVLRLKAAGQQWPSAERQHVRRNILPWFGNQQRTSGPAI